MEPKVISGIQFSSLPKSYIRIESERPKLSEVAELNNVFVIDLGCEDKSLIIKQIGNACREFGFFQVINHGVPKELVDKILRVAHEFFSSSVEEKMKLYSDDPSKTMRLSTNFNVKKETVHNWRDYLRLHWYPLEKYVPKWPSTPSSFNYCTEVGQLGFRLQEAISESLGLDKDRLNLTRAPLSLTLVINSR
ncbi:hypothetical protein BUALT_Bualt01G0212000 [Buddleja alternifolia]|uniref:Non-haem dioxygenase N-terminal domain-containing protein n=1 Tax=Buddleja alternifolia TaxID=168488 RepID=A0AAV6YJD0_9LAMI|nr:hypothetical protein BUALT_Bualt01G0212000 [Buddleja alternifolia]